MRVNILGREYSIYSRARAEDAKLKECDGYCDYSVGEIVVAQPENDLMNMRDQDSISKRTLRHELIHAFAAESGLAYDSEWAMDDEMTDWVAHQFPKMLEAFKAVGAL
nr:MAG TPA: peptidase [Caudoviricetes sp.]